VVTFVFFFVNEIYIFLIKIQNLILIYKITYVNLLNDEFNIQIKKILPVRYSLLYTVGIYKYMYVRQQT